MRKIIVAGIDSCVGANIALTLAEHNEVIGIGRSETTPQGIGESIVADYRDRHVIDSILDRCQADVVIYCGPASCSTWETIPTKVTHAEIDIVRDWSQATAGHNAMFTVLSSDAVFSGPWMFHEEESLSFGQSDASNRAREMENEAMAWNSNTLVVRTNAYGWTPGALGTGWIEELLDTQANQRLDHRLDCRRFATPILASDLADILQLCFEEELTGTYHIAGAERVNQLQFARKLADQFETPWLVMSQPSAAAERPGTGFGEGETSLQTIKIRKALCVPMPTLNEGLERLRAQQFDGYQDKLGVQQTFAAKAA